MLFKTQVKNPNDLQVLTKVTLSWVYAFILITAYFKAKSAQPLRLLLK